MIKRAFVAASALLFCLAAPLTSASAEEFKWEKNPRWQQNMDKFAAEDAKTSHPEDLILFTGSSSIVRWDVKKYFPDLPVLNRGFGGSRYTDLIDYFDQVIAPYSPKTIVLYSGDNDLSGNHTPEIVIGNVKRLIGMIHAKFPEAKVVLIPPKASISRWKLYPKMREVAEAQKTLAEENDKIEYVDTSAPLIGPDGKPLEEMFISDKLHLTHEAYVKWTELLRRHIE
jgi:lysophospholipase L1-like esterase